MFGNFLSPLSVLIYNTYLFAYQQSRQYSEQINLLNLLVQHNYNCLNITNDFNKEEKSTNEIKEEFSRKGNEMNCSNKFIIKKREREKDEKIEQVLKMEYNRELKEIKKEGKCCNGAKRKKKKNQKIKAQELLEDSLFLTIGNNTINNTKHKNYYINQANFTYKPKRYNKNKKRVITSFSSHSSTTIPLDEENQSSNDTTLLIHRNHNYRSTFSTYNFMKYNFNITKEKRYSLKNKIMSKIEQIPNLENTFFLSKNNNKSNTINTLPKLQWSMETYQNKNKYSLSKCLQEIKNKLKQNYNVNYNEEFALYLIQYNNYSYENTIEFINNSQNFSEWINMNHFSN